MKTLNWNNVRLISRRHPVNTASGRQLGLQRVAMADALTSTSGDIHRQPVVFMVPGYLQDARQFFPDLDQLASAHTERTSGAGLAPFLASQGFDVFVAELSGKGGSIPGVGRHSDWGLHELITDDLPNQLQALAGIRADSPQFWLGSGLGSVLLSCCYARLQRLPAPVLGLAHFSPGRHRQLDRIDTALLAMVRQTWSNLWGLLLGYQRRLGDRVMESRRVYRDWLDWHQNTQWRDPVDGFDYRRALAHKRLPPAIYFANLRAVYGPGVSDCHSWLHELGDHDARLMRVGRACGNRRDYGADSLLTDVRAIEDHFQTLLSWMNEISCKKRWLDDDT